MKRGLVSPEQKNFGRIIVNKVPGTNRGTKWRLRKNSGAWHVGPVVVSVLHVLLPHPNSRRLYLLCSLVLVFSRSLRAYGLWGKHEKMVQNIQDALTCRVVR